jgi:hypothetical protein
VIRGLEQARQVVEVDRDVGVVGAKRFLDDGQGATEERLGLRHAIGVPEQLRRVVEVDRDVAVVGAEGLHGDGQGATIERLGRRQAIRLREQCCQVFVVCLGRFGRRAALL